MESFFSADIVISFLTLSVLEIVLGIDNLIFIALVADTLPAHQQRKARLAGLGLALGIRVIMLAGLSWVMELTQPLITMRGVGLSFRDLLLLAGGGFLLVKATLEIHRDVSGEEAHSGEKKIYAGFAAAVAQIVVIDFVFSFDSVMTAVGLTDRLGVMVAAVVVSMAVMVLASEGIGKFLEKNPAFKMLALSFILMIGMLLVAEGMHIHFPKGYIYFAFAFSLGVECLNSFARRKKRRAAERVRLP